MVGPAAVRVQAHRDPTVGPELSSTAPARNSIRPQVDKVAHSSRQMSTLAKALSGPLPTQLGSCQPDCPSNSSAPYCCSDSIAQAACLRQSSCRSVVRLNGGRFSARRQLVRAALRPSLRHQLGRVLGRHRSSWVALGSTCALHRAGFLALPGTRHSDFARTSMGSLSIGA